jgi:2-C-methyl-D-erythritol 2,4-cyclodiphosphate synthase
MMNLRIGQGYDVHRMADGRKLVLGGVSIPYERGLLGHSDADVLTHAVIDALLGASKMGDIGMLFPDSDPQYRGISSLILLREVGRRLVDHQFTVMNVDTTLIAQLPKIGLYRKDMEQNLAEALGIQPDQVSVKATTEEHLGFTGDGSGMAAQAVVLLVKADM